MTPAGQMREMLCDKLIEFCVVNDLDAHQIQQLFRLIGQLVANSHQSVKERLGIEL